MEVDPRLLTSFMILAEELHFGRAAAKLNVSQPALSRQIRQLEAQLGAPLFTRTTRSVEPTAAGRALIDPARGALRLIDEGVRAARAAQPERAILRLGIEIDLDDGLEWVRAFTSATTTLLTFLSREYEPRGLQRVKEGSLDVFVGWIEPDDAELATARAPAVPLLAAVHRTHSLAEATSVGLDDLRSSTVAIFREHEGPESFAYFVGLLSAGRLEDLTLLEVPSHAASQESMFAAVTDASIVSFGAGEHARRVAQLHDVVLLPFEPPIDLPTYVIWRRSQPPVGLEGLLAEAASRSQSGGSGALPTASG